MPRKKVLLTVVTYPLPSRSYEELVCTAGLLENGDWVRIYPVPLSFLMGQRESGPLDSFKYNWIELNLNKRANDFRPESHSPADYSFDDLIVHERVGTESNWAIRKELCLKNVFESLADIFEKSKPPTNMSLAVFKPKEINGFYIEQTDREWREEWKGIRNQTDLFHPDKTPESMIRKLPYKFSYKITDCDGNQSKMMIEDWEIGELYWNCLRSSNGDEYKALDMVKQKYEYEFVNNKDIYLFLGTTMEWHRRRAPNPFVIIGVFYPKIDNQLRLF